MRPASAAAAASTLIALAFGGCAQSPQQLAAQSHGKEYFPSSVYGAASRRVIADGQPVPRGGGQYLVGKPYTVAGQTYYPSEKRVTQVGFASWYGDAFHGRLTANGEIYDRDAFTAAHPTMPLPSYARVTNLANNSSMIVRVNDRGPYASNRIMDVSRRVAEALDFKRSGTAKIKLDYVGPASLSGSDDAKLFATLRQGGPARWPGEQPTMVAEAAPPRRARVASLGGYAPSEASDAPPRARLADRGESRQEVRQEVREEVREQSRQETRRESRQASHDERRREAREEVAGPRHRRDVLESDATTLAHLRPTREAPAPILRHADPDGRRLATEDRKSASGRATKLASAGSMLPPSRPLDLGTIPGAGAQIGHHHGSSSRVSRSRDD